MSVRSLVRGLIVAGVLMPAVPAGAQTPPATPPDDLQLVPAEPDFALAALPTTLRMPAKKFTFRMTHRFTRPIASGTAGDFFADFFGFDSGAKIGLEVRYGLRPGTDFTFHRTSDRAIQFLSRHELVRQAAGRAMTVDLVVGAEGLNNFSEAFSGTVGAILSRQFGERGALYVQPIFVSHVNTAIVPVTTDDHTALIGLGARARLGQSRVYVVLEAAPRVAGFDVGVDHVSVAIEKRAGGHIFQLNVSNSLATTMRQVARGGVTNSDWFIGFNLTRKFY